MNTDIQPIVRLEADTENVLILRLQRLRIKAKTCDGRLLGEDGTRICDTAEATPYMLRPGLYDITAQKQLLMRGNGIHSLHGPSILVGTHVVPGVVKDSEQAYAPLYQRLKKARQRNRQIILVVRDH